MHVNLVQMTGMARNATMNALIIVLIQLATTSTVHVRLGVQRDTGAKCAIIHVMRFARTAHVID